MRILLTNDDGVDSLSLQIIKERLEKDHEVWIIAPDVNRSASSHSISLGNPTRIRKLGEYKYSCSGTPADCVIIALLGFVPDRIDLVISGINFGPNLGTDVVYSGTAAAARQGALMGISSIACSLNAFNPPFHLQYPVEFLYENLDLFHSLLAGDHFLNINFPNLDGSAHPVVTFPTQRIYRDELVRFESPNGDLYCFIGGAIPESNREHGSDYWAIENGKISLSPILIHPINHEIEKKYQNAFIC